MRRTLLWLTIPALALPIASLVLYAIAQLLVAMHDPAGGLVLERIGLACGILWVLDLVFLVLVQSISSLNQSDDPPAA